MEQSDKKNKLGEATSAISHAVGAFFGIAALVLMILKVSDKTFLNLLPVIVYGSGFIIIYTFSSIYHFFPDGKVKELFRRFDHISIYIFIASTYTPICTALDDQHLGTIMLIVVWIIAAIGATFKAFGISKNNILNIVIYISMGWIVVIALKPLSEMVGFEGLIWLIIGGVFYTLGALIYAFGKKYNRKIELFTHDTFHIFILAGTLSQFWFIYWFIIK